MRKRDQERSRHKAYRLFQKRKRAQAMPDVITRIKLFLHHKKTRAAHELADRYHLSNDVRTRLGLMLASRWRYW